MSLMDDFIEGVGRGIATWAAGPQGLPRRNGALHGRIERLCAELNWEVDERKGNLLYLHFNDPSKGVRKVLIGGGDDDVVTFITYSFASIPVRNLPGDVMAYLLCRNHAMAGVGMWGMDIDEDKEASFYLYYAALGDGLHAESLEYICKTLVKEAVDFDERLRGEGLL